MKWVDVEGVPYIVTQLEYSMDAEVVTSSNTSIVKDTTVYGEMCIYWQGKFPFPINGGGPASVAPTFMIHEGDRVIEIDKSIITKMQPIPKYEKNKAANIQWVADSIAYLEE